MAILVFILILSVLVFVHELGHFVAAKKAGILVEEFGFGLPPRVWGKKVGETLYSINALPIGGFVKLYGEDGESERMMLGKVEQGKIKGRAYFEKSLLRRLSVLLAGVSMNLVLAILCFSIVYFVSGIPTKTGKIIVEGIVENSPAKTAGLKAKDQILKVDNTLVTDNQIFLNQIKEKEGQEVLLEVIRQQDNPCKKDNHDILEGIKSIDYSYQCQDENLLLSIIPRENPPEGEGPLGIAISDAELKRFPFWQMPFLGIREGFRESIAWGKMILSALKDMIVSLALKGQVPKDIAGPVGIFQITASATQAGYLAILQFLGILSVNLAIVNILPFPALDGGRLIFLGYEFVFRKKVSPKFEGLVNNVGMIFLLALMVMITVNDVVRLIHK